MFWVQTHLPAYSEKLDELKSKGLDMVICVSVNDPFVMAAWGESLGVTGKVECWLIFSSYNVANSHLRLIWFSAGPICMVVVPPFQAEYWKSIDCLHEVTVCENLSLVLELLCVFWAD